MFIYHVIYLIIMRVPCSESVILLKWLDENQAIDDIIIPPYVTGFLKHSMRMT